MSIHSESHLPFDRNEWYSLARERLRWGANTRTTKNCGHQFCDLTQPSCCACIDDRPHRARYLKYVDGRGMVAEAKRWSDYCPGCKIQYGENMPPEPPAERTRGRQFAPTRCVTCGQLGHAMWECPRTLGDDNMTTPETTHARVTTGARSIGTQMEPLVDADLPDTGISATRPLPQAACPGETNPTTDTVGSTTNRPATTRMLSPPRPVPRPTDHQHRRARIQANFERSFGSLADIANDPDYVSPIASLYSDAYLRFQQRESERREQQSRLPPLRNVHDYPTPPPFPESHSTSIHTSNPINEEWGRLEQLERLDRIVRAARSRNPVPSLPYPSSSTTNAPTSPVNTDPVRSSVNSNTRQVLESLRRRLEEDDRQLRIDSDNDNVSSSSSPRELFNQRPSVFGRWYDMPIAPTPTSPSISSARRRDPPPVRPPTPEPLSKEELTISNECKICFSQHCDMLLLPCAHLAICEVVRID